MLGILVLAPMLTQPLIAILLVVALIGGWLAWKGVAFPLALAGIPALLTAVSGSDPLPKGGATFLTAAWVGAAILIATMRGEHLLPARGLMTLPVAMAVLLLGLLILRLGTSPDQSYGSMKVQLYAADNLVFLMGAVFVGTSRQGLRTFLTVMLIVLAAGALLLLESLLSGAAQQQYAARFTISAQQGSINLGRDSSNGALIAIGLILVSANRALRVFAMAVLPILLVSLVAAGSRGPTVAFVVGLALLLGLTATAGRARRRLILVGAVVIAGAIMIPVVVPGSSIGRSLSTILGSSSGLSSNGRSGLWAEAFNTFAQHPFFGIGTGGFAAMEPSQLYPHNILLELAVEVGVIAAAAFSVMAISMLRRLISLWQRSSGSLQIEVTLVIALFMSAFVNAVFSGILSDNLDLWLWGGLGIGLYARGSVARSVPDTGYVRGGELASARYAAGTG